MKCEYIVWGIPAGTAERYEEDLLAESCRSLEDVRRVIAAASADGFHSFRVTTFDGKTLPDFAGTVNIQ